MDYSDLEKLGLNRNEAKVFKALVKNGSSISSELVKITGFHRNIVYDNLDKLVERGLVAYIIEEGKRKYSVSPPESILGMLEKEQKELESKKGIAKRLMPEIEAELKKSKRVQTAALYRGVNGLKAVLHDVLDSGGYCCMGVSNASVSLLGVDFWNSFIMQVDKRGVKEKLLLNHDFDTSLLPIAKAKLTEVRFLPEQFNMITEIMIYGENVAVMVYTDPPIATVIQDVDATRSFIKYFDYLWSLSSRQQKSERRP
ncbi:hypothetical protein H0O00_03565 [Candidatus Micrarchaeota archaeon]|nr:hypothetical protein [Candidatus Micrarchaeota archaeon]